MVYGAKRSKDRLQTEKSYVSIIWHCDTEHTIQCTSETLKGKRRLYEL